MRFIRENYGLVGAIAALGAVAWSIIQFVIEPYWARVHEAPDSAYIEYIKELHDQNMVLLRDKMKEELVEGLERDTPQISDLSQEEPRISIDLAVQYQMQTILEQHDLRNKAASSSAILVRVSDGGVVGVAGISNRQGGHISARSPLQYGGVLKWLTTAIAIDVGKYDLSDAIDINTPVTWRGREVRDIGGAKLGNLSLLDATIRSSNIAAARIASDFGPIVQKHYFGALGLLQEGGIEVTGLEYRFPGIPENWDEEEAVGIGFGYGIALNQFHLASLFLTLANGGRLTTPTLLPSQESASQQVFQPETSDKILSILSENVKRGTARRTSFDFVNIGAATGTAEKVDGVVTTFVGVFPIEEPKFVLVVTVDEPSARRTSSSTALPIGADMIQFFWQSSYVD